VVVFLPSLGPPPAGDTVQLQVSCLSVLCCQLHVMLSSQWLLSTCSRIWQRALVRGMLEMNAAAARHACCRCCSHAGWRMVSLAGGSGSIEQYGAGHVCVLFFHTLPHSTSFVSGPAAAAARVSSTTRSRSAALAAATCCIAILPASTASAWSSEVTGALPDRSTSDTCVGRRQRP
jgi:hypothetical protein